LHFVVDRCLHLLKSGVIPTNEKNWGHVRLRPEIWRKMRDIIKKTERSLTAEVNRALGKYKPKV
jgi:hypothetical protein